MGNHDRRKSSHCSDCMRALKWIPVIFIVTVIIWSYYAYVIELCIFAIDNILEKIVFLIFYHLIFALFIWSYWNTIFTSIGTIPHKWKIPESEIEKLFRAENQEQQKRILENFAKNLPITNRTLNGAVRFCEKCQIIKPDRAHHCSVCGACVLKMDHHCPWVNNCVNFKNYKYFVLFLGYALVYCLYTALTSIEYFIKFWRVTFVTIGELNGGMGRFHILFLFFVSLMFAISLVSLFGYHIYLVLMNRTTLESFRAPIFRNGGPDKNGYNLGKYANFQEVFGDNWKLWFVPIYTSKGNGESFQTQTQHQVNTYDSMGDTQTRLDDSTEQFITRSTNKNENIIIHSNNASNYNVSSTLINSSEQLPSTTENIADTASVLPVGVAIIDINDYNHHNELSNQHNSMYENKNNQHNYIDKNLHMQKIHNDSNSNIHHCNMEQNQIITNNDVPTIIDI